jgi:hypothetical protein
MKIIERFAKECKKVSLGGDYGRVYRQAQFFAV